MLGSALCTAACANAPVCALPCENPRAAKGPREILARAVSEDTRAEGLRCKYIRGGLLASLRDSWPSGATDFCGTISYGVPLIELRLSSWKRNCLVSRGREVRALLNYGGSSRNLEISFMCVLMSL